MESENKTVPVQILVETKDLQNNINNDVYTIMDFKPYLTLEEDDYYVKKNFLLINYWLI